MKAQKERQPQTIGISTRDLFANLTLLKHDAFASRLFALRDALEKGDDKAIKKIAAESKAKAFRALTAAALGVATKDHQAKLPVLSFVDEALDEAFRLSREGLFAKERWEQRIRDACLEGEQTGDEGIAQENNEASADDGFEFIDKAVQFAFRLGSRTEDRDWGLKFHLFAHSLNMLLSDERTPQTIRENLLDAIIEISNEAGSGLSKREISEQLPETLSRIAEELGAPVASQVR